MNSRVSGREHTANLLSRYAFGPISGGATVGKALEDLPARRADTEPFARRGAAKLRRRLDLLEPRGPEGDLEVVGAGGRVLGVVQSDETVAVEA